MSLRSFGENYPSSRIVMFRISIICIVKNSVGQQIRGTHSTINSKLKSMIRVDHAGEFGADRIYAGQMAVLGSTSIGPKIKEMWDQEKRHRETFEKLVCQYRVRPTILLPIWNVAGYALGAGTALLGSKGAMACTVAVESVIIDHYNDQLRTLLSENNVSTEILEVIKQFRDEEQEHHDIGIEHEAEMAPFYNLMTDFIKAGCKVAIELSKVI